MKSILLKSALFLTLASFVATDMQAQRRPRNRNNSNPPANSGNTEQSQQTNNNQTPSGYDPYAGLPMTYDTMGAGGSAAGKTQRREGAFAPNAANERTPLAYEDLRWDDAFYAEKVWRELDLREKMNQTFRYAAENDNGSQMFIEMLLKAVNDGEVTAFADERFVTPISKADVSQLTAGKNDTFPQYDVNDINKIVGYTVTRASFDAKSVLKLRIKEEWVFDREASRFFCRIIGIAPLKTEFMPGTTKERGSSVMFWLYYPDLRPMLTKNEVYNPKNMGQSKMTWEELFESRMFSSYIIKSSLDNSSNRMIKQYIKDPILALLEGDNIKEKIFNFEQDLWSY